MKPEHRSRISVSLRGHAVTEATREKISAAMKGNRSRLKHGYSRHSSPTYISWKLMIMKRKEFLNYNYSYSTINLGV